MDFRFNQGTCTICYTFQAGGLNEYLLPNVGIKDDSTDAFAKYDECEVRPAIKDPKMPSRAKIGGHHPDVLHWPLGSDPNSLAPNTDVSLWLYW